MEEIIARIKGFAILIYPTLSTEDEFLDFVIADVVDRALVYMNRKDYVEAYETALSELGEGETLDSDVVVPIPQPLERVLAKVVVQSYRTVQEQLSADTTSVNSMSDNGQSVTFSDQMTSFLSSSNETSLFSDSISLLKSYRLAKVIENKSVFSKTY